MGKYVKSSLGEQTTIEYLKDGSSCYAPWISNGLPSPPDGSTSASILVPNDPALSIKKYPIDL